MRVLRFFNLHRRFYGPPTRTIGDYTGHRREYQYTETILKSQYHNCLHTHKHTHITNVERFVSYSNQEYDDIHPLSLTRSKFRNIGGYYYFDKEEQETGVLFSFYIFFAKIYGRALGPPGVKRSSDINMLVPPPTLRHVF